MKHAVPTAPEPTFRRSMSVLHTWAGLLLGAVLYFVFVTGTVGYARVELDRWMRPEIPLSARAVDPARQVDDAVAYLKGQLPAARSYVIGIDTRRSGPVTEVRAIPTLEAAEQGAARVEARLHAETGAPIAVRDTVGGTGLYQMHYALHYIPYDIAIHVVGLATMFMLVAILTGIVIHRRIFADFFTFRPNRGQRSWLDAHNVSSVLTLPFVLMITCSGLLYFTFEYMPLARLAATGGAPDAEAKMQRDIARIVETETLKPSGQFAPLAPIGPMIAMAERSWGKRMIGSVIIEQPGDARSRIVISHREITVARDPLAMLRFDGATGQPLPDERAVSNPSRRFARTMFTLHEGTYAEPVLRWLYLLSGALGSAMVATGSILWTTKRRQRLQRRGETAGLGLVTVERLNVGVIVGLPIGIAACLAANRLLPAELTQRAGWEVNILFIAWGLALVHCLWRDQRRAWTEQLSAAALLFCALPVLNALTTNINLGRSLPLPQDGGDWVLASVDLALLFLGLGFALAAIGSRRHDPRPHGKRSTDSLPVSSASFSGEASA